MEAVLLIALGLAGVYAVVCGRFGSGADAPRWLAWPLPLWNGVAHDWRHARPDYAKIARLERELGMGRESK
ncbi:hypothetical protein OG785_45860 [Streptomyces sp. NBC_00006]|uniref:hypothetical protein n=1 Tax=Streptomyces sp. NBC_00006 TaxID=2975619 RepID=UPI002257A707|nr:hypothetical protein [Streptomyces sp. NBC_00006]MCX5537701.1 hypothetical protein [Streptomyces sp. NBC_00006]MCX5537888.1 hypothetical protein [Streptomyces sp. NBC_00006]